MLSWALPSAPFLLWPVDAQQPLSVPPKHSDIQLVIGLYHLSHTKSQLPSPVRVPPSPVSPSSCSQSRAMGSRTVGGGVGGEGVPGSGASIPPSATQCCVSWRFLQGALRLCLRGTLYVQPTYVCGTCSLCGGEKTSFLACDWYVLCARGMNTASPPVMASVLSKFQGSGRGVLIS